MSFVKRVLHKRLPEGSEKTVWIGGDEWLEPEHLVPLHAHKGGYVFDTAIFRYRNTLAAYEWACSGETDVQRIVTKLRVKAHADAVEVGLTPRDAMAEIGIFLAMTPESALERLDYLASMREAHLRKVLKQNRRKIIKWFDEDASPEAARIVETVDSL